MDGSVAKRQSASNRDGQFAGPRGLIHVLQILRVLFGHEGDRAYLRIFGCIGRSARDGGEGPARLHLCHKILRRLSSDCVGDDIDWLEIRECRWSIECSQAISAKLEPEALEIAETHL